MTTEWQERPARRSRKNLTDPERWLARVVLIAFAALAGLAVVILNRLGDGALDLFFGLRTLHWWAPIAWMPALTVLSVWLTRRFAPGAAGSGIPQVLTALDPQLDGIERPRFVSLRVSLAKLVLTCLGLLAGLSLGREGPSVQLAAGIMNSAGDLPGVRLPVNRNALLIAGGAAGIAAAFNAPLAGVMFAIEELSRTPEHRSSGLIIGAIVFSGLLAISLQGNGSYFGVIHAHEIGWPLLLPATLVTVASGLAGGLFSRLMVLSAGQAQGSIVIRWRTAHPYRFAACCAVLIALMGILSDGATFGTGYHLTRGLLDGSGSGAGEGASSFVTLFKFIATWLTTLCMVPGGVFAPALTIGASLGHDIATWCGVPGTAPLIALGMLGFLVGTTQAPMTAFIIVMEMVDGHGMIFSLMACALVASALSQLVSPPLYVTLSRIQLRGVQRARARSYRMQQA